VAALNISIGSIYTDFVNCALNNKLAIIHRDLSISSIRSFSKRGVSPSQFRIQISQVAFTRALVAPIYSVHHLSRLERYDCSSLRWRRLQRTASDKYLSPPVQLTGRRHLSHINKSLYFLDIFAVIRPLGNPAQRDGRPPLHLSALLCFCFRPGFGYLLLFSPLPLRARRRLDGWLWQRAVRPLFDPASTNSPAPPDSSPKRQSDKTSSCARFEAAR
jgi:hypothetical protein